MRLLSVAGMVAALFAAWPQAGAAQMPERGDYVQPSASLTALQREEARLLDVLRRGAAPTLSPKAVLSPGETDPQVAVLRRRLAMGGFMEPVELASERFTPMVEGALRRFQAHYGLAATGHVDGATRAALNRPIGSRLAQVRVNIARREAFPADPGQRFVFVDIAGFGVSLHEEGRTLARYRAIAGQISRQTPAFSDEIAYVVFNPGWEVPRTMAGEDILPKVRQDPGYLDRAGFTVLKGWKDPVRVDPQSVDWSQVSAEAFPYRLVREPRGGNPLGRVKIMFPNRHHIYLHDTPERWEFYRSDRALSSGCTRVERALDLTTRLLEPQGWDRARVDAVVATGQTQRVTLDRPVPVHLVYWTVRVRADGGLDYRDDIYDRDAQSAAVGQQGS